MRCNIRATSILKPQPIRESRPWFPPKMSDALAQQISLFRSLIKTRRFHSNPFTSISISNIFNPISWFVTKALNYFIAQIRRRDSSNSRISSGFQICEIAEGSRIELESAFEIWISLHHSRNRRETCRSEAFGSWIFRPCFRSNSRCWGT